MTKSKLPKNIPDSPGIYFFLGPRKEILYIGKATSLRNRVGSYFATSIATTRSEVIESMVTKAESVEWTVTDSTLEALIIETNLIRTHKPLYNTRNKDDKSYNHLIITAEELPRVLIVRGKELAENYSANDIQYTFGPFPNSKLFRDALKTIRKIFRFYDTSKPVGEETSRMRQGSIDFNRQIGLYPKQGEKASYLRSIRHLRLFLSGKKKQLISELKRDMKASAKVEDFETAEQIKRKIFALEHIQDVALIRDDTKIYRNEKLIRIEAYDIAHMSGQDMVGVMVVVEGEEPRPSEYRKFKINSVRSSNDTAALKEIMTRRLKHEEWPLPQLIVVDGGVAQKNVAETIIKETNQSIPVVAVVKDQNHKPVRLMTAKKIKEVYKDSILLANAESHRFALTFHRQLRRKHH